MNKMRVPSVLDAVVAQIAGRSVRIPSEGPRIGEFAYQLGDERSGLGRWRQKRRSSATGGDNETIRPALGRESTARNLDKQIRSIPLLAILSACLYVFRVLRESRSIASVF